MTSRVRSTHLLLLPTMLFTALSVGMGTQALAATKPPEPIVATVEGTKLTEKDLNRDAGTPNELVKVGKMLGGAYNPDNPAHVEALAKFRRDNMAKGLLKFIGQLARAQAVAQLKAEVTDQEVIATQKEMYEKMMNDERFRKHGAKVLEALKSCTGADALTPDAAYDRYLKGAIPVEGWLQFAKQCATPEKIKECEALVNGKIDELVKKPDETIRWVLGERRLRARILVQAARQKEEVAAYLASMVEGDKRDIGFEWSVVEWWLSQQRRKVNMDVPDPAVAQKVKAALGTAEPAQPK